MTMRKAILKNGKRLQTGLGSAGFSLLELFIASMIGLIVLAAVVTMYWMQSKQIRQAQVNLRLQQTARSTVDLLHREFRITGMDGETKGQFGIIKIQRDDNGNATLGYTSDVGGGPKNLNGVYEPDNEYFEYSLQDFDTISHLLGIDSDNGSLHLCKTIGIEAPTRILVMSNVEAMNFAFAFDNDNDNLLDTSPTSDGSTSGVIWAIDTNQDDKLDTSIDSDFDGRVVFGDKTEALATLTGTTDIEPNKIRAMKVWILFRSREAYSSNQFKREYYLGDRRIVTGAEYDPRYQRVLHTYTVYFRNMGLQNDGLL
ncbi:MAG: hypothetical protein GY859_13675 [Desulfobacterales bacterium]|nr:hypothetical protein [Desulfobacterales bacterium]